MMKHAKKGLMLLSLTFVLSACTYGTNKLNWSDYKNDGEGISLVSERFSSYDISFDSASFEKAKKAADEACLNNNLSEFNTQTNKVFDLFSGVRGKFVVSRARYYASGSSSDKKSYEELYDTYLGFYSWYYTFLIHVNSADSNIRSSFFGDMSEKEIVEYIDSFYYTEETQTLDAEITSIQDGQEERYNEFISDMSSTSDPDRRQSIMSEYIDKSIDTYRELLDKGNKYAKLYGFDDYLSYTYSEYYCRNYTYDFVEEYAPLIEEYVVPLIYEYKDEIESKKVSDQNLLNNFMRKNFCYKECYQADAIDSYMERVGGSMLRAYNYFKSYGYYCFTTNPNSLGTAYVTTIGDGSTPLPLIFFSSNYQDAHTFVHEFGHYTVAYTNSANNSFPFDIKETHSQANEMLFSRYLQDYYKDSPNLDVYQFAALKSAYKMLTDVALTFATAEVETYVFKNIDKENEEILEGVEDIWDKYYDRNTYGYFDTIYYWCTPVISSTGYYISYATSGVASLGVYVQALENYDLAIEHYLKLIDYATESREIKEFFDHSGLYSPLEESTFKKLEKIFE